jgi:hypothetical protein
MDRGKLAMLMVLKHSSVCAGEQKHKRRIPVDSNFVERKCHLIVEPHAYRR